MDYIEETLKFFESEEMREHLRTWPRPLDRNDCAEIVSCAPVSLETKIPILDLIAEQTKYDPEKKWYDPAILAKHARLALDGRYNNPPGTVFLLDEYYSSRERSVWRELLTTFEAVIRCIKEQAAIEDKHDPREFVWFYVEKWIPHEDGQMRCPFYWYLNSLGEIWYFDYPIEFEPEDFSETLGFFDRLGDLDCPVPFKPGDIIIADCRPYAKARKVLILENKDIVDCCGVRCLYITLSGKIDEGALKHNSFLCYPEKTRFSVLYRATVYNGELADAEAPLGVISAAIKENNQLGLEMHRYLIGLSLSARREDNYEGVEWEDLKVKFNL